MSDRDDEEIVVSHTRTGDDAAGGPRDGADLRVGDVDDQIVEDIAEDVRAEILLGHVEDDVSHVLEERLEEVGLKLPPEDLDDLADEIENDVSS